MGTGISDMLLRSAEEKAKELNMKELFAEVKKKNKRAIEFFKRNGYVEIGDNEELATLVKRI
jgi:N-acetylglutamate synthase-like GNAT family acetyltransferase